MSKKTIIKCDICGKEAHFEEIDMQIIFLTEQDEGNFCLPYFEIIKLDLCGFCHGDILLNKDYIVANGCMGHNEYRIAKNSDKGIQPVKLNKRGK